MCITSIRTEIIQALKQTRRFSNHESCLLSWSHTFAIIVILDLKIHQSMWIHWPFFPKTWTKGHWPLDNLWPHVCWGHMCDSIQESLCWSPMTIHQCMWIQWSILQNTTYTLHTIHTTYILRTVLSLINAPPLINAPLTYFQIKLGKMPKFLYDVSL